MDYPLHLQADKPVALWMLDTTNRYFDYTGRSTAANIKSGSTAAIDSVPLVAGTSRSTKFNNSSIGEFSSPVFKTPRMPFALEAWVYPMATDANQIKILSHDTVYDGLLIDNTSVYFTLSFAGAGTATVSHRYIITKKMHLVGLFNGSGIELYVNGELVGTTDLTDAQLNASYTSNNGNLYSGQTTGTGALSVAGIALYSLIPSGKIASHFQWGNSGLSQEFVSPAYEGIEISLTPQNTFLDIEFDESELNDGFLTNMSIINNRLVPVIENDLSLSASWVYSIPLSSPVTSTYAIGMHYVGYGMTIESSLNGTSWTAVDLAVPMTNVGQNFNPTNKTLYIRVTFPAGVSEGPYVESLRVIGMTNNIVSDNPNYPVTLQYPAFPMRDYEAFDYNDFNGIKLNGGSVTVETAANGVAPKTMDFWVKTSNTITFDSDLSGSSPVYTNGNPTGTWFAGEWTLRSFGLSAGMTTPITLTGSGSGHGYVGNISIYQNLLTAAQMVEVYKLYTASLIDLVPDGTPMATVGSTDNILSYSYNWQTVG